MAYDAATHQLILFGSNGNSTWAWNGTSWSQVDDASDPGCTSCSGSPPYMTTFGMAYDPLSRAVIVVGGDEGNDTWAWTGSSWKQVADASEPGCTICSNSPPATIGTQMAFDAATNQLVLFGGGASNYNFDYNDTWLLTFHGGTTYTWSQVDAKTDPGCTLDCLNSPPDRNVATMAYDTASKQLVLFGGEESAGEANGQNDTWIWNGTSWQQVDDRNGADAGCGESRPTLDPCPTSPPARVGTAMAFDPALGQLVLFGGMNHYGSPEYNDTWTWNGSTWTHVNNLGDTSCSSTCTADPSARDTFALADDAASSQLIMFGGGVGNQTWAVRAVAAPPSAPLNLKTTTSGAHVTVSWSAPAFLGASPVTRYKATAAPGNESCVTPLATTCTLSGLSASKRYVITVKATNSVGTGPGAVRHNVKG